MTLLKADFDWKPLALVPALALPKTTVAIGELSARTMTSSKPSLFTSPALATPEAQ